MGNRLDMAWRGFGTALFLALIGLGGTAMAVSVFAAISAFTRDPRLRQRRIQRVMYHSFRLYCRAMHFLRVAEVEFSGLEKLADLKGALIVANHPSLLDVVMIMSVVANAQCVVKAGLWRHPFFRLTVGGAGYIRNDLPPEDFIRACVDTLHDGNNLIIFPEGTRTVPGEKVRCLRGFANIATMAEANVQVVTITCDPPILHKGNPWWRVPRRRSRFHMEVGELLDIKQFLGYGFRPLAARKLVAFLEHFYAEKLGHGRAGKPDQDADRVGAEAGGFVT